MFGCITLVGMGLIGSSLARVIRRHRLAEYIIGIDCSEEVRDQVCTLDLVDRMESSVTEVIAESDLVMVCTPLSTYTSLARQICPLVKGGTILTDVGSVKQVMLKSFGPYVRGESVLVPGHPVAGTEYSGPCAGFAELFHGRWCILTPQAELIGHEAVQRLVLFWEACGSRVEVMDPVHHDQVLALMSHLPHLIAYTIVGTAVDLETSSDSEVLKFAAGGFRDFTRIAASNPIMWRDVFLYNSESVLDMLQRFTEDLTALQRAIRWGEGQKLEDYFTRTREIRRKLIALGQD